MNIKNGLKKINGYYFKKKLVTSIIVGVFAIAAGVGAGIVIDKFVLGQISANYDGMDAGDYSMDTDSFMEKYNALGNCDDYSTKFTPAEMINIGFTLYKRFDNTMSITKGTVHAAGTEQLIRAANVKADGEYLEESISLGVIPVATRTYQNSENIRLIRGTNIQAEGAVWPDECVVYTNEEYIEDFGKTPSDPCIYIISSKTITESSITRDGTDYVISTKLTKKSSVLNYIRQMKSISNLKEYPSFNKMEITFTLDSNLLIKKAVTSEAYFARTSSGLGSTCDGGVTIEYFTDGNFTIPDRNTPINYSYQGAK